MEWIPNDVTQWYMWGSGVCLGPPSGFRRMGWHHCEGALGLGCHRPSRRNTDTCHRDLATLTIGGLHPPACLSAIQFEVVVPFISVSTAELLAAFKSTLSQVPEPTKAALGALLGHPRAAMSFCDQTKKSCEARECKIDTGKMVETWLGTGTTNEVGGFRWLNGAPVVPIVARKKNLEPEGGDHVWGEAKDIIINREAGNKTEMKAHQLVLGQLCDSNTCRWMVRDEGPCSKCKTAQATNSAAAAPSGDSAGPALPATTSPAEPHTSPEATRNEGSGGQDRASASSADPRTNPATSSNKAGKRKKGAAEADRADRNADDSGNKNRRIEKGPTLQYLLRQHYEANSTVALPSFKAGTANKPVPLDDIFTEMCKVDHAELLKYGHSQYEDLLARKKVRVPTDASIEFNAGTKRVLLEGKPGSGKTTLVNKLAFDWARNPKSEEVGAIGLVFGLPLRAVQHDKLFKKLGRDQLDVLLHKACLHSNVHVNPEALREAIQLNCSRVLIILDGLDEYDDKLPVPIVNRLLGLGEPDADADADFAWYKDCKILVTSRPTTSHIARARQWSDTNYELWGFNPAQMKTFVERCLAVNTTAAAVEDEEGATTTADAAVELCEIVAADPDLAAACRTVYTLALICAAYDDDRSMFVGDVGDGGGKVKVKKLVKLTDIYLKMARKTAAHNVRHRGLFDGVRDAKMLTDSQRESLKQALGGVSELALKFFAGASARHEFTADEVGASLLNLGLLTCFEYANGLEPDEVEGETGTENRYMFVHLTIQEFMAAWALVGRGFDQVKDVLTAVEEHATDPQWHMVLRFAIGLLHRPTSADTAKGLAGAARAVATLAEHGTQKARDWRGRETGETTVIPGVLALCLQCLAEADGAEAMLRAIEGVVMAEVELSSQGLTDVEVGALGKALPMLGKTAPKSLKLDSNQFGVEGLRWLMTGFASNTVTVMELQLGNNSIGDAGAGQLAEVRYTQVQHIYHIAQSCGQRHRRRRCRAARRGPQVQHHPHRARPQRQPHRRRWARAAGQGAQ